MRPHNSGHWTMDGARTSQFEQHLRAVLDYPLGDTGADRAGDGDGQCARCAADARDEHGRAAAPPVRRGCPRRRCTCTARPSGPAARSGTSTSLGAPTARWTTRRTSPTSGTGGAGGALVVARASGPTDGMRTMAVAQRPGRRHHGQRQRLAGDGGRRAGAGRVRRAVRGRRGLGAPHPGRMLDYARTAAGRGIEVIIAGAGGAAHLPGMVAVGDAAAGDRRAGAAGPARRPRFAAVDRADARRCAGGDGVDRRRPQRRAAGGADPRLRPIPRCASAWSSSRPISRRWCCEKDAALRDRLLGP